MISRSQRDEMRANAEAACVLDGTFDLVSEGIDVRPMARHLRVSCPASVVALLDTLDQTEKERDEARRALHEMAKAIEPFARGPDSEAHDSERLGFSLRSNGQFTFGDVRTAARVLRSYQEKESRDG